MHLAAMEEECTLCAEGLWMDDLHIPYDLPGDLHCEFCKHTRDLRRCCVEVQNWSCRPSAGYLELCRVESALRNHSTPWNLDCERLKVNCNHLDISSLSCMPIQ